eukprot:jgi/Chlat1/4804/Chrsp31S04859
MLPSNNSSSGPSSAERRDIGGNMQLSSRANDDDNDDEGSYADEGDEFEGDIDESIAEEEVDEEDMDETGGGVGGVDYGKDYLADSKEFNFGEEYEREDNLHFSMSGGHSGELLDSGFSDGGGGRELDLP